MTGPLLTMNSQAATALLSGGIALVVALLGIAGAIAAQLVASRRAFANSLALFERQNAAQKQERAEETRREEARQLAEERKRAYARLLRTADDLQSVQSVAEEAQEARAGLRRAAESAWRPRRAAESAGGAG